MELDKHEVLFRVMEFMARHGTAACSRLQSELQFAEKRILKAIKYAERKQWCASAGNKAWELTLRGSIEIGLSLSERNIADEYEAAGDGED